MLSSKLGPTIKQQQQDVLQQMVAQLGRLESGLALLGQPGQGAEAQRPPARTIAWLRASCYPLYKQVRVLRQPTADTHSAGGRQQGWHCW